MSKTLLAVLLALSVPASYAQTTGSSDSGGKTRAEVKADSRTSGSLSTRQTEYANPPSTRGSGTSRAEVKAAERSSGALGTKQIEYSDPAKRRKGEAAASGGAPTTDPFAQSREEKAQAKGAYQQEKARERAEYKDAKKESQTKLKVSNQRSEVEKNLEVPR